MPSSLTMKSSALRVKTSWPDLVLTSAGRTTSEERTLMVALGLVSEVGGVCAAGDWEGGCADDWAIAGVASSNARIARGRGMSLSVSRRVRTGFRLACGIAVRERMEHGRSSAG